MVQHRAMLTMANHRKSYMIYQTAPFSLTLNDPYHHLKVTSFLTLNISETVRYRHSFNEILIGTFTRPTQQCRFE